MPPPTKRSKRMLTVLQDLFNVQVVEQPSSDTPSKVQRMLAMQPACVFDVSRPCGLPAKLEVGDKYPVVIYLRVVSSSMIGVACSQGATSPAVPSQGNFNHKMELHCKDKNHLTWYSRRTKALGNRMNGMADSQVMLRYVQFHGGMMPLAGKYKVCNMNVGMSSYMEVDRKVLNLSHGYAPDYKGVSIREDLVFGDPTEPGSVICAHALHYATGPSNCPAKHRPGHLPTIVRMILESRSRFARQNPGAILSTGRPSSKDQPNSKRSSCSKLVFRPEKVFGYTL